MVLFFIIIILVFGKLLSATNKFWIGNSENTPIELITTLNVGDYTGGSTSQELPNIGDYFKWMGYEWIVVHETDTLKYFISRYILKNVQWKVTNNVSDGYEKSNIKQDCDKFYKDSNFDDIGYFMGGKITDTGVGKVFIPTYAQLNGGFSWINSDSRRYAETLDGVLGEYWTATTYSSERVRGITIYGSPATYPPATELGFRPCIAISY